MNRATIALIGAMVLVVFGILPFDTALESLDVDTLDNIHTKPFVLNVTFTATVANLDIVGANYGECYLLLLFAMMIVNVHLRLAGFFDWVSARIVAGARSPRVLLAWIIAAGILSALFSTICSSLPAQSVTRVGRTCCL